jgi:hypothetical protein
VTSPISLTLAIVCVVLFVLINAATTWVRTRQLVAGGTVTAAEARRFVIGVTLAYAVALSPAVVVLPLLSRWTAAACAAGTGAPPATLVIYGWFLWSLLWILVLLIWVRWAHGAEYLARFWPSLSRGRGPVTPTTPKQIRSTVSLLALFALLGGIAGAVAMNHNPPTASCPAIERSVQ